MVVLLREVGKVNRALSVLPRVAEGARLSNGRTAIRQWMSVIVSQQV